MKAMQYTTCISTPAMASHGKTHGIGSGACLLDAPAPLNEWSTPVPPTTSSCQSASAPADLSLLYESRDRQFCLFEFGGGHLAAVNALLLV